MLADPIAAVDGLQERLAYYAENAGAFRAEYATFKARLDAERQQVKAVEKEKGLEAAQAYEREHVSPLLQPTRNLFLNARYFLLAGFSMRRFVGGRMYLLLKNAYLDDLENPGLGAVPRPVQGVPRAVRIADRPVPCRRGFLTWR